MQNINFTLQLLMYKLHLKFSSEFFLLHCTIKKSISVYDGSKFSPMHVVLNMTASSQFTNCTKKHRYLYNGSDCREFWFCKVSIGAKRCLFVLMGLYEHLQHDAADVIKGSCVIY